ncbi:hypothetical protein CN510_17370 [Priestia megaterium]|uniref:PIN domain-containing protein n=1 Tax=Priestia megaterium TaxID=1404 RepID=UPI000BFA20BE|nr:PIN domain-containing protein [Priestia megaterium]PES93746.1 hypothetical protein CN510_17370 [Priestia megaterium]
MLHLCLDTCTWIYIARLHNDEVIKSFESLVEEGKVTFVVPEIVIQEFKRTSETAILNPLKDSYHTKLKNINDMAKLLDEEDGQTAQNLFQKYTRNYQEVLATHHTNIDRINSLLEGGKKCIPSSEQKALAADWACEKKPPFFGEKKNEMTDCLILFSALNAYKSENLKPFIFITDNVHDFAISSKEGERNTMHKNLQDFFDGNNIKYLLAQKITELINNIKPELIKVEKAKELEEDLLRLRSIEEIRRNCEHEYDTTRGTYKHSMFGGGLSLHYMCKHCGMLLDTGDYFD